MYNEHVSKQSGKALKKLRSCRVEQNKKDLVPVLDNDDDSDFKDEDFASSSSDGLRALGDKPSPNSKLTTTRHSKRMPIKRISNVKAKGNVKTKRKSRSPSKQLQAKRVRSNTNASQVAADTRPAIKTFSTAALTSAQRIVQEMQQAIAKNTTKDMLLWKSYVSYSRVL